MLSTFFERIAHYLDRFVNYITNNVKWYYLLNWIYKLCIFNINELNNILNGRIKNNLSIFFKKNNNFNIKKNKKKKKMFLFLFF